MVPHTTQHSFNVYHRTFVQMLKAYLTSLHKNDSEVTTLWRHTDLFIIIIIMGQPNMWAHYLNHWIKLFLVDCHILYTYATWLLNCLLCNKTACKEDSSSWHWKCYLSLLQFLLLPFHRLALQYQPDSVSMHRHPVLSSTVSLVINYCS